jgi:predicted TIM-barrel fold metal-dependent hydrolase
MLAPEADGFDLMDLRLMTPLMERCAERNAIAFFRCGFPPAQPAGLLPLAESYPGVKFIISNLGLRIGADAAAIAKRCPNVYLETSLQTASVIKAVLGSLDLSRVLFGSCAPFGIPQAEIKKVNALPKISDEQKRNVLGENLSRLLALQ